MLKNKVVEYYGGISKTAIALQNHPEALATLR